MKIAVVRLRKIGKRASYAMSCDARINDYVIVEADRCIDYGEILGLKEKAGVHLLHHIVRKVTSQDRGVIKENERKAAEAIEVCSGKIKEYKLAMKLVTAEYSFDNKKIIFYFISSDRVDFRELVKELAKVFKIRIEMRQIGVRDETRIFGGIGFCGRGLCCATFLRNFEPVSIKMAKQQKLPLNPSKISGVCGRLMCCLSYEHKNYQRLSKALPKEGDVMDTPRGKGKVNSVNILSQSVCVKYEDGYIEKISFKSNE